MAEIFVSEYGEDAAGNKVYYADKQSRADIAKLKDLPAGWRIVSSVALTSQQLPEGMWTLEDYHNFNGDYVYTRVE